MSGAVVEKSGSRRGWQAAALIGRLVVGGLFVYAASSKILDPMEFAEEVRAYELAPVILTNAIAIVLPWLELFAGVLLIVGFWRAEARLVIFLMMVGFTFGKVSVEVRGMDINCGCFTVQGEAPIGIIKIMENIMFAGFGGFLWWLGWKEKIFAGKKR